MLVEWPAEEKQPIKFWLATVPEDVAFERLVELAKLRWRIERDYQELKQELGLGHFKGRGWRGFHHHASLWIAAYAFLVAERARIPPRNQRSSSRRLRFPVVRPGGRPPIRPERHVENSIATMRRHLIVGLVRRL